MLADTYFDDLLFVKVFINMKSVYICWISSINVIIYNFTFFIDLKSRDSDNIFMYTVALYPTVLYINSPLSTVFAPTSNPDDFIKA